MKKMKILIKIKNEKDIDLARLVKELSLKLDDYPNSAIFLTIGDAIKSKEDILEIESLKNNLPIQRDFIPA